MEKLRIILLASGDLYGGAEAVIYNLVMGLKAYPSINICVVLLNNGRLSNLCLEQEVETKIIDEARYNIFQLAWKFANIARSFRPHIIHSHRYKENILALITRLFAGNPKLVTTVHGMSEGRGKFKTRIASRVNLFFEKHLFDRIVAVSGEIAENFICVKSFPSRKVIRIHNGIELPRQVKDRRAVDDDIVIGSAGRLFPVKDYLLMVDIAKDLCTRNGKVNFVLAGDGPEREKILSKIMEYGINNRFKLLGHLDDMEKFYSTIDLYLNTSQHEGIPVTIIEAMSHRIPVIAPAVGGLPEVVEHGKSGWLVKNRDAWEFAVTIENLISDNRAIATARENAYKRAKKHFSNSCMTESYIKLYLSTKF